MLILFGINKNLLQPPETFVRKQKETESDLDVIYKTDTIEIYEEEAEQSRLMMAISAGIITFLFLCTNLKLYTCRV